MVRVGGCRCARVPWLHLRGDGSLVVSIQSKADIAAGKAPQLEPKPQPQQSPNPNRSRGCCLTLVSNAVASNSERRSGARAWRAGMLARPPPEDAAIHKPIDVRPPPKKEFEVRVVCGARRTCSPKTTLPA